MTGYKIKENKLFKFLDSDFYHYRFDKTTGVFARWGFKEEDDPDYCPFGPEILDIEVTTQCQGPGGRPCSFCYKSNGPKGHNMSFETFKKILDRMPRTLTQCAFGADAQAESNPDLWKMMDYCREHKTNSIVPNITVADISDETADKLKAHCGAVAVSRYADKNICYDSVKKLTDRGLQQTNIHMMISQETLGQATETVMDYVNDSRLANLNAIVLLSLKKKGRGKGFTPLTYEQFRELIDLAFEHDVPIGFDSCSAPKFLKAIEGREDYDRLYQLCEPCESTLFSSYISTEGSFHPCSFAEGDGDWIDGIDVVNCKDFVKDIWTNPRVNKFRHSLLNNKRNCPIFEV